MSVKKFFLSIDGLAGSDHKHLLCHRLPAAFACNAKSSAVAVIFFFFFSTAFLDGLTKAF